ncbi:hypothetical protein EZV62_022179 [Acer yangbiense]|uniref:DUF659 domain-containing protein n=1 Tax=Acer yangbiense TaxID=1000413 RepID=A0A5C7H7R4_9ROSI|nr:hypothetical protein EZV62_022179 [Acer yangbiense]
MVREEIKDYMIKKKEEKEGRNLATGLDDYVSGFGDEYDDDMFGSSESFIGQHGPGMKVPSYHEVRVPLLKQEVKNTRKSMKAHEEEWVTYGCSIFSDGWKDRRERTLINFLINSLKGSMFMESIDASAYAKTGEKMFELFSKVVDKVGLSNMVQVVTDSASNNVLAERLVLDVSTRYKIDDELVKYKRAEGLFGSAMAIRRRTEKAPAARVKEPSYRTRQSVRGGSSSRAPRSSLLLVNEEDSEEEECEVEDEGKKLQQDKAQFDRTTEEDYDLGFDEL